MAGAPEESKGADFTPAFSRVGVRCLTFLGVDELCSGARVSRAWRAASNDPSLWSSVSFPFRTTDRAVASTCAAHRTMEHVKLKFCPKITQRALGEVVNLPQLQHLDLEGSGRNIDDRAVAHLSRCNELTSLVLDGCYQVTPAGLRVVASCPKLERLSINGIPAVDDGVLALLARTNITRFHFNSCGNVSDKGVLALIAEAGARLRELHVGYCSKVTDNAIVQLTDKCPNLALLHLYGCSSITDKALAALGDAPNLTTLDLSLCSAITNNGIVALCAGPDGEGPSPLLSLNLYNCLSVGQTGLAAIARFCPKLTFLGCYGLDQIDEAAIRRVLEACPNLRRMNVGGCTRIAGEQLAALRAAFPRVEF